MPLPAQQHEHDAGYDLCAREDVTLPAAGGRALVPTGLASRSRRATRVRAAALGPRAQARRDVSQHARPHRSQYRGELKVLLVNTDPSEPYTVHRGDRIAQLVIAPVESAVEWHEVTDLDATTRDTYGFGSTGR